MNQIGQARARSLTILEFFGPRSICRQNTWNITLPYCLYIIKCHMTIDWWKLFIENISSLLDTDTEGLTRTHIYAKRNIFSLWNLSTLVLSCSILKKSYLMFSCCPSKKWLKMCLDLCDNDTWIMTWKQYKILNQLHAVSVFESPFWTSDGGSMQEIKLALDKAKGLFYVLSKDFMGSKQYHSASSKIWIHTFLRQKAFVIKS